MKTVYLAGLISTERPESLEWRDRVTPLLEGQARVLDPMRGKKDLAKNSPNGGLTDVRLTSRDIVIRDYGDVVESNIILVNLNDFGSTRPLIGTLVELGWAWEHRKLVVAIGGSQVMKSHPFIAEFVSHWFDTEEEAIGFILERVL